VLNTDSAITLANRVHQLEHLMYPKVIEWYLQDQILLHEGKVSINPPQSQLFMLGFDN
jgi:phosphoribosylglycinamide formyltransferase-1